MSRWTSGATTHPRWSRNPARVVLKLQGGKPEVIPVDEIDEQKTSELSLMPDDVHKTLTRREQLDLFALLTLDKPPADPQARSIPGLRGRGSAFLLQQLPAGESVLVTCR